VSNLMSRSGKSTGTVDYVSALNQTLGINPTQIKSGSSGQTDFVASLNQQLGITNIPKYAGPLKPSAPPATVKKIEKPQEKPQDDLSRWTDTKYVPYPGLEEQDYTQPEQPERNFWGRLEDWFVRQQTKPVDEYATTPEQDYAKQVATVSAQEAQKAATQQAIRQQMHEVAVKASTARIERELKASDKMYQRYVDNAKSFSQPKEYTGGDFYRQIVAIANNPEVLSSDEVKRMYVSDPTQSGPLEKYTLLTDNEKDIIRYYYGKGDTRSLDAYLAGLDATLDYRKFNADMQALQELADKKGPWGELTAAAMHVAYNIGSPLTFANTILNAGKKDVNQYSGAQAFGTYANKASQIATSTSGPLGAFLISTGISIVDMAATLPLGPTGALTYMSLEAAGNASADALSRGATPIQAAAYGTLAGAVEYATEKLPIDNLFRLVKGGLRGLPLKKKIIEVLKQAGIEAGEELAAEYGGVLVDAVTMGEKSEYNQYIAKLVNSGMSAEEAKARADYRFFIQNPLTSAAGGALSGFVFGAGGVISGSLVPGTQTPTQTSNSSAQSAPITSGVDTTTTTGEKTILAPQTQAPAVAGVPTTATTQSTQDTTADMEAVARQPVAEPQTQEQAVTAQPNPNVLTLQQGKGTVTPRLIAESERSVMDDTDKATMRDVEKTAKRLGVKNIKWAWDITHTENGVVVNDDAAYDPNTDTVYLALDAKGSPYVGLLGHEIGHSLEGTEHYNTILQYAVEKAKADGTYDTQMENLRNLYGEQAEKYLQQELVSRTITQVFNDKTELRRLVNSRRGVIGAIINAIDTILGRFRNGNPELSKLRTMLQQALDEKQTAEGEVKSSRREQTEVKEARRTSNVPTSVLENPNLPAQAGLETAGKALKGRYDYEQSANKTDLENARIRLERDGIKGASAVLNEWVNEDKRLNSEDMAYAMEALFGASELDDLKTYHKIFANIRILATEAGQVIQIMRHLKDLSPEGRYIGVQRILEVMQEKVDKKFGEGKVKLKLDQALVDSLKNAKTVKEMDVIEKLIKRDLARQVPSTVAEKLNAWRYLSMLGNPKTHFRNVMGNSVMYLMANVKDLVGAVTETGSAALGVKGTRTKSIHNPFSQRAKDARAFAKRDVNAMMPLLKGEGKETNLNQAQRIFKTRWLEAVRRFNINTMEKEDSIFLRANYTKAFSAYMIANKLTPAQMKGDTLDKARMIAITEAQKNTFRDASAIANALNKWTKAHPVGGVVVEGLLPFKRTPINILKRGAEYSPLGLFAGVYNAIKDVRSGKYSSAKLIDDISKAVTGTGMMILGMWLKSLGLIRASGEDDDKEEGFEELKGRQRYSLEIGDTSITLDWLNPTNIPLFMGVELQNMLEGAGTTINFSNIVSTLATVSDPLMQMSMLQGLENAIGGYSNNDKMGSIGNILQSSIYNYASQYVPTMFGQLARTIDATRRTTYAEQSSEWTKEGEQFGRKLINKIPGLTYLLQPYINIWGEEDNDSKVWAMRAIENFVLPAWINEVDDADPVNMELEKLFARTGETSLLPKYPDNFYSKDGNTRYITSEEIDNYRKNYGQTAYGALDDLFDMKMYDKLSTDGKLSVISQIYAYSTAFAKSKSSLKYAFPVPMQRARDAERNGIDLAEYFVIRYIASGNDSTSNISQPDIVAALEQFPKLTKEQKAYIWWSCNTGWKPENNPYIKGYQP